MSRLDYVTIAIVAVCVAALVYLIYMTTNLLGDSGEPATTTEEAAASTDSEDQEGDTYYFDDEGRIEGDGQTENQPAAGTDDYSGYDYQNGEDLDKGRSSSGGSTAAANEMDPGSGVAEGGNNNSSPSGSRASAGQGQYMVIAGTFSVSANAQEMEKKLRGMGYNNTSLEPFDRGKYTVVMVDRFGSISEAKSLATELEGKGVPAYVKRK